MNLNAYQSNLSIPSISRCQASLKRPTEDLEALLSSDKWSIKQKLWWLECADRGIPYLEVNDEKLCFRKITKGPRKNTITLVEKSKLQTLSQRGGIREYTPELRSF